MSRRLVDQYRKGDRVEILLRLDEEEQWVPGVVLAHDFPGLWVRTENGAHWFVTNSRRIRHAGAR